MSGLDQFLNYKEIGYMKKFNLGNYETEQISLSINLNHNADVDEAFKKLKAKVHQLHNETKEVAK